MKNLIYLRHGRKDGENIAADHLAEIRKNGIPEINELIKGEKLVFHFGSYLTRTRQTQRAFEVYLNDREEYGNKNERCYLSADPRFGNEKMFAHFVANDEIVAEAKKTNWLHAFSMYDEDFFIKTQSETMKAVKEMFASVKDGLTIISIGHTPLIEWAAYGFDKEGVLSRKIQLKELTGFVFTEDVGRVSVTRTIGF